MAGLDNRLAQPMSIKDIAVIAEDFDFNPNIPLKYWLRTANAVFQEVGLCRSCFHECAEG